MTKQMKSCAMLATLTLSVLSIGVGKAAAQPKPQIKTRTQEEKIQQIRREPNLQQREIWRKSMVRTPRPKKGCFVASYPETKWRELPCKTPPNRPYPPRKGIRPQTVGNGVDFSNEVTANTSQGEGSFDSVSGVTSETGGGGTANSYSLQLNTNPFTTTTCSTSPTPASCQGWEQFVFSSSGYAFIQYWMLNYGPGGTACPATWNSFSFSPGGEVFCWRNASSGAAVPAQTVAALSQMKLDGAVAGVNGNVDDTISLSIGASLYSASGDNYFPDLTNGWRISEFNVFGDCCGSQANFNTGSTMVVRTAVNSGTPALPPTCDGVGFTGETNNLTLVSTPAMEPDVTWPSIIFTQSNAGSPTMASCAAADSVGDTHLKTFNGLLYDFQASGDFVLAKDGSDFEVQARQASGAPTWPNASINKAVAVRMGKTRVALHIEPTRLIVDGRSNNLADGRTLLLPSGVQVSRRGNVYDITSENGDSVRAVLNGTWMDVTVGLGHPQTRATGLLSNPHGNAQELMTSKGVVLREPVSFFDLYHSYGDSWRVQPHESLFTEATTIRPGIPDKPFYANHLDPQEYQRALATCKAAGVKTEHLLDACTLDTVVLKDERAARVFVRALPPRMVIKPVLRLTQ